MTDGIVAFGPSQLAAKLASIEAAVKLTQEAIVDQASAERATAAVKILRDELKAVEDMRTSVTKPLLDQKRKIDGWFKPLTSLLEAAIDDLRRRVGAFASAERERQAKALQESAAAMRAGQTATAVVAVQAANVAAVNARGPKGTTVVDYWEPEVVDARVVPREWCTPDVERMREAGKAGKPPTVAGVRWHKKQRTTVR